MLLQQHPIAFLLAIYEVPSVLVVLRFIHGLHTMGEVFPLFEIPDVGRPRLLEQDRPWSIGNLVDEGPLELKEVVFYPPLGHDSIGPGPLVSHHVFLALVCSLPMGFASPELSIVKSLAGDEDSPVLGQDVVVDCGEDGPLIDLILVDDPKDVAFLVVDEVAISMEVPLFLSEVDFGVPIVDMFAQSDKTVLQLGSHLGHDHHEVHLQHLLVQAELLRLFRLSNQQPFLYQVRLGRLAPAFRLVTCECIGTDLFFDAVDFLSWKLLFFKLLSALKVQF